MSLVRVDLPKLVRIPTSELGRNGSVGVIIAAWRNTIAVMFTYSDNSTHIGYYNVLKHQILEAKDEKIHLNSHSS